MGILDKLVEKKDLMIYFDLREKELNAKLKTVYVNLKPSRRETACRQIIGRIKEIKRMRRLVAGGILKEKCKEKWVLYGDDLEQAVVDEVDDKLARNEEVDEG